MTFSLSIAVFVIGFINVRCGKCGHVGCSRIYVLRGSDSRTKSMRVTGIYWKKYPGGGLESEGEQIESVHLKVKDIDSFLMDQSKEKSTTFFVAFYWWKYLRTKK